MTRRRRLALVLLGLVATGGAAIVPAAHAAEPPAPAPTVVAPAAAWTCAWLKPLANFSICLSNPYGS